MARNHLWCRLCNQILNVEADRHRSPHMRLAALCHAAGVGTQQIQFTRASVDKGGFYQGVDPVTLEFRFPR